MEWTQVPPPSPPSHSPTTKPYQEYGRRNWPPATLLLEVQRPMPNFRCRTMALATSRDAGWATPTNGRLFKNSFVCVLILLPWWWLQQGSWNCWHLFSCYYCLVYQECSTKVMSIGLIGKWMGYMYKYELKNPNAGHSHTGPYFPQHHCGTYKRWKACESMHSGFRQCQMNEATMNMNFNFCKYSLKFSVNGTIYCHIKYVLCKAART